MVKQDRASENVNPVMKVECDRTTIKEVCGMTSEQGEGIGKKQFRWI